MLRTPGPISSWVYFGHTTVPATSKGEVREDEGLKGGAGQSEQRKQRLGFHTISPLRKSSALPLSPSNGL